MAVELKLTKAHNGRLPSGAIQRFVGQCALAKAKHQAVVGFVGYRGSVNEDGHRDTEQVVAWFKDRNVTLVVRSIP
jgi:hypothetical protein